MKKYKINQYSNCSKWFKVQQKMFQDLKRNSEKNMFGFNFTFWYFRN